MLMFSKINSLKTCCYLFKLIRSFPKIMNLIGSLVSEIEITLHITVSKRVMKIKKITFTFRFRNIHCYYYQIKIKLKNC